MSFRLTHVHLCFAGAVDDSVVERPSPAANMWQAGPPLLRRNSEDVTPGAASAHSPTVGDGFRRGLPPVRQSSDGAATTTAYEAWRRGSPQPVIATIIDDQRPDGDSGRPLLAVGRGMAGGDDAARVALAEEFFGAGSGSLPAPGGNFASFRPHHPPAPLQLENSLQQQQQNDPWSDGRYGCGSGPSSGSTPGLTSTEDGYGYGGHLGADSFMGGSASTSYQPCLSLQRFGFCRDGPACSFSHIWDSAQQFGLPASLHTGQPILAQQPINSFISPSPTSSLLSLDSPARPYGSPSPSPQPAPMLVSQDSVGFAFGAPGSAAFSASAGPRTGHASPSPQQQSLARAAFANAVAAQQYGGGGGGGTSAASDQRVHDPRLVRAALDPGNTFVGGGQSMFDGGAVGHDASFRNI